ncbi:hypothetical protein, partial [Mycobacteroides abscessus]|uniref:hypothetical protein n=1 Tax=Mycobacteroides abscessus TaxID=36809 RepID=UPI0013FDD2FF
TKYVREPLFRANYGVNLDDVIITPATDTAAAFTCGNVYDSAILDGVPADEIKDRIAKQCPKGDTMARTAGRTTRPQPLPGIRCDARPRGPQRGS